MNVLYVAPDIPVPHTGEFVRGSMHVMKVAEGLAKKGNKVLIVSRRTSRQIPLMTESQQFACFLSLVRVVIFMRMKT